MCKPNLHARPQPPWRQGNILGVPWEGCAGNSRSYSGPAEKRKGHFAPTASHSRSRQNLTCVVGIIVVSKGKEMKAQRTSNDLRELAKLMDDIAGTV